MKPQISFLITGNRIFILPFGFGIAEIVLSTEIKNTTEISAENVCDTEMSAENCYDTEIITENGSDIDILAKKGTLNKITGIWVLGATCMHMYLH